MTIPSDCPTPIAASASMRAVFQTVDKVANAVVPVLVLGETGTGKEVVARAIHDRGARAGEGFVCLNCGGMSPHLVESTLFGYERGAFTGAVQRNKGVFEAANGGTVFLDEIGELPLEAQASLLRVLETRRLVRVGSTEEIEVDVRVVAATHRDLEAMCRTGSFRWDLYYRLNVITISVPPLRARVDDIPPLADLFARRAAEANGARIFGISPEALRMLAAYDWPGNVRELKNTIERAVVVTSSGWIEPEHLSEHIREGGPTTEIDLRTIAGIDRTPEPTVSTVDDAVDALVEAFGCPDELLDFKTEMARHEIAVIVRALELSDNNQTEAARRLKMPLRTLVHKIKVHDIRRIMDER